MNSLYNKTERRQLAIMRIIFHSKDWVSFDDIADKVNSSRKSVQNDLDTLAIDFADFMEIKLTPRTVKANFPADIGFSTIQHQFAKQSLTHTIIDEIFKHPGETLEQIAERTFVSDMTVARRIKYMNSSLQYYYNILIDSKSMTFLGQEVDIRSFFINFYSEAYNALTWSFNIKEEIVHNLMARVIRPFNIPVTYDLFRYFKIATMVNITRLKQGYHLDISKVRSDIHHLIKKYIKLPDIAPLLAQAEELFGIPFNHDNIIQIFGLFLSQNLTIVDYNPEFYRNNQATVNYSYIYLQEIISDLCQKFDLTMEHSGDFIQKIHNIAHLRHLNIGTKPIFYDRIKTYLGQISQFNIYFYESLSHEVLGYCQKILKTDDSDLHQFIVYSFYIHWKQLIPQLIFSHSERYKALVISYFDYGRAEINCQLLSQLMGQFIDFHPFNHVDLDLDALQNCDYDIIISDFQIPHMKGKHFLIIDDLPQLEDLEELYKILHHHRDSILERLYKDQ